MQKRRRNEPDLTLRQTIDMSQIHFISCKVLIMAINQLVDSGRQKALRKKNLELGQTPNGAFRFVYNSHLIM